MTPEEYFAEHPGAAVLAYDAEEHYTEIFGYDYRFSRDRDGTDIDWTGYDRRIAYNPEFKWGKKREIEWGPWLLREPGSKPSPGNDVIELQSVSLPDGWTAYRYGDYVDPPVDPGTFKVTGKSLCQPELSRFLPDGYYWAELTEGWTVCAESHIPFICDTDSVNDYHERGLLHPSEGGGFQKHTPGDDPNPCPCMDLLFSDSEIEHEDYGPILKAYISPSGGRVYCEGWRPHFPQEDSE